MSEAEELETAEEIAAYAKTSKRTIYRMAQLHQVPFYRVGARGVRFIRGEVLAVLRQEPTVGVANYRNTRERLC